VGIERYPPAQVCKNKKERKMETITSNKRVVAALGALTLTVVGFCVIISYMW